MGARVVKRPVNGLYVHPVEDGCAPNFFFFGLELWVFLQAYIEGGL